jgi:hypothetical protein
MKIQNTILGYGVAAVGALFTAGISFIDKNDNPVLDGAIFCFFIPLVVYFIVMIWAGEVARMYRAGKFLVDRESIINQHINSIDLFGQLHKPALFWENWLSLKESDNKTPHHKLYSQHYFIMGMFLFIALLSITIGNYKISGNSSLGCLLLIDASELVILTCLTWLALSLVRHYHPPIARWLPPIRQWISSRRRAGYESGLLFSVGPGLFLWRREGARRRVPNGGP